jgi:hypothetical protein
MNPDYIRKYLGQQQQETAQVAAAAQPTIDVPVVYTPPPVVLKGTLSFVANFNHDAIAGIPYDQIVQKILDAFAQPDANNPWLPTLQIGNVQAWREEVGRTGTTEAERERFRAAERGNPEDDGGVPPPRYQYSPEHGPDSEPGIADGGTVGRDGV